MVKPEKNESKEPNGFDSDGYYTWGFDQGYISSEEEGKIIVSERFDQNTQKFIGIHENIKIEVHEENKKYLKFHRENILKR